MKRLYDVYLSEDRENGLRLDTRFSVVVDDADVAKAAAKIWGTEPEGLPRKESAEEHAKQLVCARLRQVGELEALVHVVSRSDRVVIG